MQDSNLCSKVDTVKYENENKYQNTLQLELGYDNKKLSIAKSNANFTTFYTFLRKIRVC